VPLLFFFYYFNFMYRAQIGIRFYLVLFPLLYVFCGSLVRDWLEFRKSSQVALGLLVVTMAGSVLADYPHYIPYFNELIWDQKQAYKYLVDSNLDWDQSEWIRDRYLEEHPEMILEPERPVLGRIVVSPNNLVGIVGDKDRYDWLRENFEPIDMIADVYLVYDISEDEYQRILDQLEE
jgi:hypothetical protein